MTGPYLLLLLAISITAKSSPLQIAWPSCFSAASPGAGFPHSLRDAGCPGPTQGHGQPATVSPPRPQDGLPPLCPQSPHSSHRPLERKEGSPGRADCEVWPEATPEPRLPDGNLTGDLRVLCPPPHTPKHLRDVGTRRHRENTEMQAQIMGIILII